MHPGGRRRYLALQRGRRDRHSARRGVWQPRIFPAFAPRPIYRPAEDRRFAGTKRVSDGTRTRGRRDHNPELYQLSYAHQAAPSIAAESRSNQPRQATVLRSRTVPSVATKCQVGRPGRERRCAGRRRRCRRRRPAGGRPRRRRSGPCRPLPRCTGRCRRRAGSAGGCGRGRRARSRRGRPRRPRARRRSISSLRCLPALKRGLCQKAIRHVPPPRSRARASQRSWRAVVRRLRVGREQRPAAGPALVAVRQRAAERLAPERVVARRVARPTRGCRAWATCASRAAVDVGEGAELLRGARRRRRRRGR